MKGENMKTEKTGLLRIGILLLGISAIVFACILSLAVFLLGCAETESEPKAEEVLRMVLEKHEAAEGYKGIGVMTQYGAVQTYAVGNEGIVDITQYEGVQPHEVSYSYAMKPIDRATKWKLEYNGKLLVCNGTTSWTYNKEGKSAYRGNCSGVIRVDYYPSIEGLLKCSQADLCNLTLGTGELSGRACYIIQATFNENLTFPQVVKDILWIDKEYLYPLKIEKVIKWTDPRTDETRTDIMMLEYKNIEFNVSDEEFEFIPPEDTKIIEIPPIPPITEIPPPIEPGANKPK